MSSEDKLLRLPVGGQMVYLRPLGGTEDLLLAEASAGDTVLAVTLADHLAIDIQGARLDWAAGVVTDLDAFVIFLRRTLMGDKIRADVTCGAKNCGRRFDIEFSLGQYLQHHAPSVPSKSCRGWSVQPGQEPGWYQLAPGGAGGKTEAAIINFRLPTPNDQLAVRGLPDAAGELARRCLQPGDAPALLRRRAEAVMEAMAPCLSGEIQAVCPECNTGMALYFEPRRFCLQELRDRAASIYADVDVLARRYHWSEDQILALPRLRRIAYVELARLGQSN